MPELHAGQTGKKINTSENSFEPLFVSIKQAAELTAESDWRVKQLLAAGVYRAVKSGRRTLIIYESLKDRVATLPRAEFAPPRPRKGLVG